MSFSQTSKYGLMFFNSLHTVSHQSVLPFPSSKDFASGTDLGILTQNLCVQTQYFDFSFPMMWLRFTSTCQIHHANAGSPAIRSCTVYSAICTGYDFFLSLRVTHFVLPSFHCTRASTPFVIYLLSFVSVRFVMNAYGFFTPVLSYLWLIISWNRTLLFTSPST